MAAGHYLGILNEPAMRTHHIALPVLLLLACGKDDGTRPTDLLGDPGSLTAEFYVKPDEWFELDPAVTDVKGHAVNKDVYILTDAVLQNGEVRVYLRQGMNSWRPLPALRDQGGPQGLNWRFVLHPGRIQIRVDADGAPAPAPTSTEYIRVLAIPD